MYNKIKNTVSAAFLWNSKRFDHVMHKNVGEAEKSTE